MQIETGRTSRDTQTLETSVHGIYVTLEDGTEFHIRETPDGLKVTCLDGSVIVRPHAANVMVFALDPK